jgi:uncharacterized integral membrane protein
VRITIAFLILILLAVTIFVLSNIPPNTPEVKVMFWQWELYRGSLASVVVGAGVLGALLTYISSLVRIVRLGRRVRELENQIPASTEHREPTYTPPVEYLDKDNFPR